MQIVCPNCTAQYDVADDAIPAAGREVQCTNCGNVWHQHGLGGADAEPVPAPEAPAAPVQQAAAEPAPEVQQPVPEPAAPAEVAAQTPPVAEAGFIPFQSSRATAPAETPAEPAAAHSDPRRADVKESVKEILQAEAAFSTSRAAQPDPVEEKPAQPEPVRAAQPAAPQPKAPEPAQTALSATQASIEAALEGIQSATAPAAETAPPEPKSPSVYTKEPDAYPDNVAPDPAPQINDIGAAFRKAQGGQETPAAAEAPRAAAQTPPPVPPQPTPQAPVTPQKAAPEVQPAAPEAPAAVPPRPSADERVVAPQAAPEDNSKTIQESSTVPSQQTASIEAVVERALNSAEPTAQTAPEPIGAPSQEPVLKPAAELARKIKPREGIAGNGEASITLPKKDGSGAPDQSGRFQKFTPQTLNKIIPDAGNKAAPAAKSAPSTPAPSVPAPQADQGATPPPSLEQMGLRRPSVEPEPIDPEIEEIIPAPEPAKPAAAADAPTTSRQKSKRPVFADVDALGSALDEEAEKEAKRAEEARALEEDDDEDTEEKKKSKPVRMSKERQFWLGFWAACILAAAGAAVYYFAELIGTRIPGLEGPIAAFTGWVDGLRTMLQELYEKGGSPSIRNFVTNLMALIKETWQANKPF